MMIMDAIYENCIEQENGCIEWQGPYINKYGHGVSNFAKKQFLVHRVVLEIKLARSLSDGECSCHACDNPRCVNPLHLFAGTNNDNMQDASIKGRMGHKITPDIAKQIFNATGKQKDIGERFGVSGVMVHNIKAGKAWAQATMGRQND